MQRIAVIILLVMASGCSDGTDDATPPAVTAPTATNVPSSAPADDGDEGFEVDEFGSPSPEAIEGDRALRSVSATHADCGSVITTSGAPTTMVPSPEAADCILAAAASGRPSQYSVTGRDGLGGMEGTTFRVDGPSEIVRIDYSVAADGTVTFTETSCSTLMHADASDPVPTCG